jgi:hypothetical protein
MARKGARIRGHFTSNANIENQCVGLGDGYSKTQARAIRGVPPAGYGVAKLGIEYRAGHPLRSGRRRPANKSMIGGILGEGSGFVLPASQIPLSAISPSKSGLNPQTETKGPRCIFAVVCHLGLLFNHNRLLGANGSD